MGILWTKVYVEATDRLSVIVFRLSSAVDSKSRLKFTVQGFILQVLKKNYAKCIVKKTDYS